MTKHENRKIYVRLSSLLRYWGLWEWIRKIDMHERKWFVQVYYGLSEQDKEDCGSETVDSSLDRRRGLDLSRLVISEHTCSRDILHHKRKRNQYPFAPHIPHCRSFGKSRHIPRPQLFEPLELYILRKWCRKIQNEISN
jgi:hypothetical protein